MLTKRVLQTVRDTELYAKISKKEIWLESMAILCNIMYGERIKVDTQKIKAVQNCPRLTFQLILESSWVWRAIIECS